MRDFVVFESDVRGGERRIGFSRGAKSCREVSEEHEDVRVFVG